MFHFFFVSVYVFGFPIELREGNCCLISEKVTMIDSKQSANQTIYLPSSNKFVFHAQNRFNIRSWTISISTLDLFDSCQASFYGRMLQLATQCLRSIAFISARGDLQPEAMTDQLLRLRSIRIVASICSYVRRES